MHAQPDFNFMGNWFDKKWREFTGLRWPTMKLALNMLHDVHMPVIVETGCVREPEDRGAGNSTILFAEYVKNYGGHFYSIDNEERHVGICRGILQAVGLDGHCMLCEGDSVEGLTEFPKQTNFQIDLLYLDSYDYPYGTLLDLYGGQTDIDLAQRQLHAMTEQEIVAKHGAIIAGAQEHCLKELEAAMPSLADRAVILIDDSSLPGGGKSRTAKLRLIERGWTCLFDDYQTLWVRR